MTYYYKEKLYPIQLNLFFQATEYIKYYFQEKIWFPTPTILYHRDTYCKILASQLRFKNPNYFASGDLWSVFSLNMLGAVGLIAEPLLSYRQHSGQESRNVDQGKPVVDAIQLFYSQHKLNSSLRPITPSILGFLTRFRAQEILFANIKKSLLIQQIQKLRDNYIQDISKKESRVDTIIPFDILLLLLGISPINQDINHLLASDDSVMSGAKLPSWHGFRSLLTKKSYFME